MNRVLRMWGMGVGACGLVVLIYFLSSGPVMRAAADTRFETSVTDFYSPLENGLATIVEGYLRMWGCGRKCCLKPIDIPMEMRKQEEINKLIAKQR